ncbi:IS66 family insertion sequence element accessory protein TnpA [Paenibacillus sp. MMS20-IR301]|uniref:IS66 family insertion sequence element accessory protein TnpA n=1 Tax=Paenibacillus sp. MMS20-IR301 TaxID=2895946 RepID=UPI0037C77209
MIKAEQRQYEWTERIRDYRASGRTMAAWWEAQGGTLHQLKYWLRKIDSSVPSTSTPHFIPVTVSPPPRAPSLTLRFGPATLDVREGFSPELLRQVVQALEPIC